MQDINPIKHNTNRKQTKNWLNKKNKAFVFLLHQVQKQQSCVLVAMVLPSHGHVVQS
jgi:hypothetical protein